MQLAVPPSLYRQFSAAIVLAVTTVFALFFLLHQQSDADLRWIIVAGLSLGYHFSIVAKSLHENRADESAPIDLTFGAANWLSLLRGVLNSLLAGFILSPFPDAFAWLPAILWTISALIDIFDGIVARVTNRPTQLGAMLDLKFDTAAVLIITVLLVWWRQLPVWSIVVGLAGPLFTAGRAWRTRRGLPVF